MELNILEVKNAEPVPYYLKWNGRYFNEKKGRNLFFEANSHRFILHVSFLDECWFPMNVYHYLPKNEKCPFCLKFPNSTGSCAVLKEKRDELFNFILNLKSYRLQGLYDFS